MTTPTHTHYSPYGPPRSVTGTLVECDDAEAHSPEHSEIFADYMYSPRLVPSEDTGLPALVEQLVLAHYLMNRDKDTHYAITDTRRDEAADAWEVVVTNRWMTGDGWHSERYRFDGGHVSRVVRNPHPGYVHEPPWCPNCGY